jgi:hypothetical protein
VIGWPFEIEALRRRLWGLREAGWITFENPRRGPEVPWIFRLSGAAIDGERDESLVSFDPSFLAGRPVREETVSAQAEHVERADPQPEDVSEPAEFPRRARAEQSRAKSETKNLRSEETKLDHVVRTTTAAEIAPADQSEPEFPPLLDALEPNPFHESCADRPVSVEQAEDGSLVWTGEPQEGEQGVLDDVQALVDAGFGEWRETDDGGDL